MPRSFEADLNAEGLRIAVVASRFNDEIVSGLLAGALECLERHGAADADVTLLRVPGAFEIPTVARKLVDGGEYDAIVTLGCLLKGDTPHFDFISAQVTNELSRLAVSTVFPVVFGVITCNTYEQAVARSSPGAGNKGWEAALAAIEMANLWKQLDGAVRTESPSHSGR
jgi:6,7-dimethyl-8-ribityllumazine synthase